MDYASQPGFRSAYVQFRYRAWNGDRGDPEDPILDVARHHPLRQLRAQDHLVSRPVRSRAARYRHHQLLYSDGGAVRRPEQSAELLTALSCAKFGPLHGGATTD